MPGAAPFLVHQARGLQHLQMLRHRGAADRKLVRELADRGCPPAQQVQDGLAGGIGEGRQEPLFVSHDLP